MNAMTGDCAWLPPPDCGVNAQAVAYESVKL